MHNQDTKVCQFCGEEIKSKAIKCKYCHSFLTVLNQKEIDKKNEAVIVNKDNNNEVINRGADKNTISFNKNIIYILVAVFVIIMFSNYIGSLSGCNDRSVRDAEKHSETEDTIDSEYIDEQTAKAMYNRIQIGMTEEQVRAIAGEPTETSESEYVDYKSKRWQYNQRHTNHSLFWLSFIDGEVFMKNWHGHGY